MASEGPLSCNAVSQPARGGTSWTAPENIVANDSSRASVSLSMFGSSQFLLASDFQSAIPDGATIDGVAYEVDAYSSLYSPSFQGRGVSATQAGSPVGNAFSNFDFPSVETSIVSGGSANLGGVAWTPSQVNDSGSGFQFYANNGSISSLTAYVDNVRRIVYYTLPSGPATAERQPRSRCRGLGR